NHSLFLIALALTFLFLLIAVNEAKVFTKCELASILKGKGMDGYHGYSLGNWICMAYHESRYNSRAVGPRNSDGSRDYGIFQINSRYWCKNNQGPTANGCNKPCSGKTPNAQVKGSNFITRTPISKVPDQVLSAFCQRNLVFGLW
uniref:Lysozyme n=1 Tax=Naja naja TaxID=35670 RepID=A0A8C6X4Z4_NAJNA